MNTYNKHSDTKHGKGSKEDNKSNTQDLPCRHAYLDASATFCFTTLSLVLYFSCRLWCGLWTCVCVGVWCRCW